MNEWKNEQANRGNDSKLLHVLWKIYGNRFAITGIAYLIESVLKISQAYLLGLILRWFQFQSDDKPRDGYVYVTCLAFVVFLQAFLNQLKHFWSSRIGMQVKIALTGAIFKRSLELTVASNIFSHSQIIQLTTIDVQKFEDASQFVHFLWCGPFELVLVTFFLYSQIGWASFVSVFFIILLIPFQV